MTLTDEDCRWLLNLEKIAEQSIESARDRIIVILLVTTISLFAWTMYALHRQQEKMKEFVREEVRAARRETGVPRPRAFVVSSSKP